MINSYSRIWFELLLETRPYTAQEVAFVVRNLPNPPYRKVLDLCCGEGRHTTPLANKGYEMVGIDLDTTALSIAAKGSASALLQLDMRDLRTVAGHFDAILSLWQSFGYFDEKTNRDVLYQVADKLDSGGRLILDIYNRLFWELNQGERQIERKGISIHIEDRLLGNRLRSSVRYGDGLGADTFEWQLFTLDEIVTLCASLGLELLLSCTECDERKRVSAEKQMMQLVFQKI